MLGGNLLCAGKGCAIFYLYYYLHDILLPYAVNKWRYRAKYAAAELRAKLYAELRGCLCQLLWRYVAQCDAYQSAEWRIVKHLSLTQLRSGKVLISLLRQCRKNGVRGV